MSHIHAAPSRAPHPGPTAPARDRRRWWTLVLLCLAQFMVILDVTVVNLALPTVGADLGLGRAALTWVITAYTLCFGGLMLLGGRLADLAGRRRTFLSGLAVFTLASLASGVAWDGSMLVAARAGQGIGAALLSPAALSIVTTTFHGPERNRALGVWAAVGGTGAAVGVLLGGLLTSGPGWRWVFFINVPVGVVVAAAVPRLVGALRSSRAAGAVDLAGAALGTAAMGALIYGLVAAGDHGWASATTLVPLLASVVLLAAFVLVERGRQTPLLRLQLLARRPVAAGSLVMLAGSALLLAAFFLTSLYVQRVAGYSPLRTGLLFLPFAVAIILGAHVGGRLVGQLGPRPVAATAFAVVAAGIGLLTRLPADPEVLVDVLPGFMIAAVGIGAVFVTATTTAMSHVDHAEAGMTSGLINTCHELGAALGVAVVSTIAGASVSSVADVPVQGFGNAFLAGTVAAVVVAVGALRLLPRGRLPATDGPVFAH